MLSLFLSLSLLACSPTESEAVVERKIAPFEILHDEGYAIYQSDDLIALEVIRLESGWAYGANKEIFLALDNDGIKKFEDDVDDSQELLGQWWIEPCGESYICGMELFVFAIPKDEIKGSWSVKAQNSFSGLENIHCSLKNKDKFEGRKIYSIICDNDEQADPMIEIKYSKEYGVETMQRMCEVRCGDVRKYTLISKKGIAAREN